jgi:pimeloyl-ACP methyl ester carboxylesterase
MTDTATATLGAAFTPHTVESDGLTIKYYEAGTGDTLVALHGAGGVRFSRAHDILAETFHLVVVEMPGWGEQANDRADNLDDLADEVAAAITAIGLETYHLLGTSIGGATALRLTTRHPDRVISLVLEGPAEFRVGATAPGPELPPEEMTRRFRRHPERPPTWEQPDPSQMAKVWPFVTRLMGEQEYDEELAGRLHELPVRTLILFGEFDGVIPPSNGSTYRQLLQTSSFQIVADAAHDVQGDRPEAFADIVEEFIRRGMAFLLPDRDTLINP